MADTWTIKSQVLQTDLSDTGTGFTPVWEVTYNVNSGPAAGTVGKVRVPASQFNAPTVKAAIDAQVTHLHQVASL